MANRYSLSSPCPPFKFNDFLGWHEQGDGKLFLGISIQNGRILDQGDFKLKTVLRQIVEKFRLPMRLTGNHDVVLYDIDPAHKAEIQTLLKQAGIKAETEIDPLVRYSMACPALPTCGLAITESERILPDIIGRVRALLNKLGLGQETFFIRMTGCPNGCARPYMAELGFVGSAPNSYQVWLGGSANQTRLAQPYIDRLHEDELEASLEPIFVYFRKDRKPEETFGDFCDRVGLEAIRQYVEQYDPSASEPHVTSATPEQGRRHRRRVSLSDELYDRLKQAAAEQNRPMTEITAAALEQYLKQ